MKRILYSALICVALAAGLDAQSPGLRFVPVTPCRVIDTRTIGVTIQPLAAFNGVRTYAVSGTCGVPASAKAFSLNVTAVPRGPMSYMTVWPAGEAQPFASLLNSFDGRIVAAATIVKAGLAGQVSVFATDSTEVIIDVNGYFVDTSGANDLVYYPVTPCRIIDSRLFASLFVPYFAGGQSRSVDVLAPCSIPSIARAYALNFTAVVPGGRFLSFLAAYPTGVARPLVSTLNAFDGGVVANAAIVPAGTGGAIDVFVTDTTDLVIDINGYFAPPGNGQGLSLYVQNACRVADTRPLQGTSGTLGPPTFGAGETRTMQITQGRCTLPSTSNIAYVLNATVVPQGSLGFITLWPGSISRPLASTLNSFEGRVVSNMAIIPAGPSGAIQAFASNVTDLIFDLNGYFAP